MGGAGIPSLAEPVCTSDAASDSVERDLPADCSVRRSRLVQIGIERCSGSAGMFWRAFGVCLATSNWPWLPVATLFSLPRMLTRFSISG
jgi:hypothetical protein